MLFDTCELSLANQTSSSDFSSCETNSSGKISGEKEQERKGGETNPRARGEKRRSVAIAMFQGGDLHFSGKGSLRNKGTR